MVQEPERMRVRDPAIDSLFGFHHMSVRIPVVLAVRPRGAPVGALRVGAEMARQELVRVGERYVHSRKYETVSALSQTD